MNRAQSNIPRPIDWLAEHAETLLKLLALAATPALVLLFFLKFAPDISTAVWQHGDPAFSPLSNYPSYWKVLEEDVFQARFAGNWLVYGVAKGIERVIHIPSDPRLHPLRLAAAIVSTLSVYAGIAPVLFARWGRWRWAVFYSVYMLLALLSIYVYTPYDLPSLAFISWSFVLMLGKKKWATLAVLLVGGCFRESMLHSVWFAVSMLVIPSLSLGLAWTAVYFVAYWAQWLIIRKIFFPSHARIDFKHILENVLTPTSWASAGILLLMATAALVVIARRARLAGRVSPLDRFFLIQVFMAPVWLVFYDFTGGNWAEFRMLTPIALPLAYALAAREPDEAIKPAS